MVCIDSYYRSYHMGLKIYRLYHSVAESKCINTFIKAGYSVGGVSDGWVVDQNTPGTAGGPGGRDRTLAVKSKKNTLKC